jgi:hypothetical protein
MRPSKTALCGSGVALIIGLALMACDESSAVKDPVTPNGTSTVTGKPTATPTGSVVEPTDGGPTDCIENPKTHLEIINACTKAVKIRKDPVLVKLLPDGGLPPLF